jgi:RNA polymerase sigma-70 factor (ECF subfamily)
MGDAGDHDEDAVDARRVLAGDVAAFAGIVGRWQGRLVNLAWRFCRDRSITEDMAQEAFLRAFRALGTFRGDAAFSTWLTAIAMNSYRSAIRNRRAVIPTDLRASESAGPSPLAALVADEEASAVRRMVMALPTRYRDALVLYYFEEMNLAETARVLQVPPGTLKARIHRGEELLRRRLTTARVTLEGQPASKG